MRLSIHHHTTYRFDAPSDFGLQQLRMTPKSGQGQTVVDWRIAVEGARHQLTFEDQHRNQVDLFSFDKGAEKLVILCEGSIELTDGHGIVGPHLGPAPLWLYQRTTPQTKPGPGVRALVRQIEGETDLACLHDLMARIGAAVTYEIGVTRSGWDAEMAVAEGRGVCQDHAHVLLSAAREMGHPARYVSGYLMLDESVDQTAMHAWAEVHLDGLGWVGFDVSNGISPDNRYVRVATGLDYAEAAPVTGVRFGDSVERLDVAIRVAEQQ